MSDDFAKELAMLPTTLVEKIQEELERVAPGEFEVIGLPDGGLVIVQKEDGWPL